MKQVHNDRVGLLSQRAVREYHETGFLGPFDLLTESDAESLKATIDADVLSEEGPWGNPYMYRHLDSPEIYDLCANREITERVQSLVGENLLLWATTIFDKQPGADAFSWHQDTEYFDLEPPLNVTAWIALTDSVRENGCMQIIPGSHRRTIPHITDTERPVFEQKAHPDFVDEAEAVDIELEPGQFILFNERTLHRSLPNTSSRRRTGLSARITTPFVYVNTDDPKLLIAGEDRFGLNEIGERPR